MAKKTFKTVESFLKWFEDQIGTKVYIVFWSDSSGLVRRADTEEDLIVFNNPSELSRKIDSVIEQFSDVNR